MDWNTVLFAAKWAIIGLVYFVLFLLVIGVYLEMSPRLGQKKPAAVLFGQLRVIHPGKDPHTRSGQAYPLQIETRIGAEKDNDIILADPFVSGHHARLHWDGAQWWIEDLGSRNGTTINQKPVSPRNPQPLRSGTRLGIGEMLFELVD